MSTQRSTLYTHATIITVNPEREVILDRAILVTGSRITGIGKTQVLTQSDLPPDTTTISLAGRIILPGLINTHAHLAQSLLRGLAEDLTLHSWLCEAIWPLEASYAANYGYVAARLTIAEMLKSGTTCFLESMLTHRSGFENVVRAVGENIDFMSISSMLSAHATHHGSFNGRLHVWAAAGTPRGSPLSSHLTIGEACKQHDIGFTMHCAEAPKDLSIYKESYGCTPMQFCRDAKLTGPKTILAHMVHLDLETDLPILEETHTNVAHNPNSNLKLASGIAEVPKMLERGINMALGTDGAPCGNTYDMFREMHLAGILHKGKNLDAESLGAEEVIEMATINGAKALGLESEIGSLEVGKKADFVVVNPGGLNVAPFEEAQVLQGVVSPLTVVVYSCTGADVETVLVDRETLVKGGELVKMDEMQVMDAARISIRRIRERSGVKAVNRRGWKYT